jgi:hypothetical protein
MLPIFRPNDPLPTAAQLNNITSEIRANTLLQGVGYTVNRGLGGTSLSITPGLIGGGSTAVCPFKVTIANKSPSEWKFRIQFGFIGGKIPTGMFPGDLPPLIMEWTDGWVLAVVTFVIDKVDVDTVLFELHPTIPANTETTAYYPIAYISTDTTDPENPAQLIQNLCATPVPSVCDLVFVAPTPP